MTVHRTVLIAAAAAVLLASNHTIAQAPKPDLDAEQRLKALENKMDRVLKLMEANAASKPASPASAIQAARDKVKADLKAKEEERQEFLAQMRPDNGAWKIAAERLGKYEGRRSELKMKFQEMNDQLVRIEKAYRDGGNKAALQIIRALGGNTKGLDEHPAEAIIERLKRQREKLVAVNDERHPSVADVDEAIKLVRKIYSGRDGPDARDYIATMKEELADLDTRIQTLSNMFEKEVRDAREMNAFQVKEVRLREETDALRNTLKVLDSLLTGDAPQKPK